MSEFQTKPNPSQPDRCSSIDPHDELQCGRRIHDDDQCAFDGIAWKKGSPRYVSDAEKVAALVERVRVAEDLAESRYDAMLSWRETAGRQTTRADRNAERAHRAEAAVARVEALAKSAGAIAGMHFNGEPFPPAVTLADLRAALASPSA